MFLHEIPVPPVQRAAAISEAAQQQQQLSVRAGYAVDHRSGLITVAGETTGFRDDRKPFSIHTVTK